MPGRVTRLAGSLTDITDTKVADALTGLPNRLLFVDLLDRAIKRTERHPDYVFALLVLGLDRFKVRESEPGRAQRRSAAHFGCASASVEPARNRRGLARRQRRIHTGAPRRRRVHGAARRHHRRERCHSRRRASSRARCCTPFDVEGHQVFTSAVVGITVSTTGYERPEQVLQDAAIALHRAKAGTLGGLRALRPRHARTRDDPPAARDRSAERHRQQGDHRALPAHHLARQRDHQGLRGARALAPSRPRADQPRRFHSDRRRHRHDRAARPARSRGVVPADGGMADGSSVVWRRASCASTSPPVSSASTISPQKSRQILDETGLEPSKLKLEITESAFLGDVGRAEATLASLQSMGVEWSIDDFGTGYSSLSYLHRLQANTVKVDRSFVSRMGVDAKGSEMVRAIVALALNLGMDVVAEGVETHRADGRAANARLRACPGILLLATRRSSGGGSPDRVSALAREPGHRPPARFRF